MLGALRSNAGGWVAKIFITLLAGSFAVWGVADVFSGRGSDTLAEVGEIEVTTTQYQNAFNQRLQTFSRRVGRSLTPSEARLLGLNRQVLSEMLQNAALAAQAQSLGLTVSAATVAQRIANTRAYQDARGNFDPNQFRALLRSAGLTEEEFIASEAQTLVRAAVISPIERGLNVPKTLVELAYRHENEERDIRYVKLTGDVSKIADPSDSELKAFYDKNKRLFAVPERRVVEVLQVVPSVVGKSIEIPHKDLLDAYERSKGDYGQPEKRTVEQIVFGSEADAKAARDKIAAGTTFDALAKERGLKPVDLKLGTFTKANFPDSKLADAAFALKKGEVSQPVTGALSTVLLRVSEIEEGEQKSFGEVSEQLEARLQLDRAHDLVVEAQTKVEELRASGQPLADIAKELKLELITTPPLDTGGRGDDEKRFEGVNSLTDVMRAAFQSDVGIDNDPVTTRDDGIIWYVVKDIKKASTKPLDEVRDDAVKAWKADKLGEKLKEQAEALIKRLQAGERLDAIAKELAIDVSETKGMKRTATNETLDSAAVRALFSVEPDKYAYSIAADGKGGLLMHSTPVLAAPYNPKSQDAVRIEQLFNAGVTQDILSAYLADLQNAVGVKINDAVWARLNNSDTPYNQQGSNRP